MTDCVEKSVNISVGTLGPPPRRRVGPLMTEIMSDRRSIFIFHAYIIY